MKIVLANSFVTNAVKMMTCLVVVVAIMMIRKLITVSNHDYKLCAYPLR